jgi:diaminohydroxyphosphoribosylaminopyrimidine deaminase/5-amino-6-(5-phosphoribosylamino)uracil reductase
LYVNLEPCSHFGKTPPCTDLIISQGITRVVAGMIDPFEKVAGAGLQKLRDAGIEVIHDVLLDECLELNKRFITYVTKRRPYIIIKWAQTADGFIAPDMNSLTLEEFEEKRHITGFKVQKLVHKWRNEEDAIMVGAQTIITDNPALNARAWPLAKNPVRITFDRNGLLDKHFKIFDQSQTTFIFTLTSSHQTSKTEWIQVKDETLVEEYMLKELYQRGVQSLIIEGGTKTIDRFVAKQLWDEMQVFTSPKVFGKGVKAPAIIGRNMLNTMIDGVQLKINKRI